ncbi:PrpR N-terminal domain-containing protein [Enterococcus avium]
MASELFENDYDAIISRGGTADLIRQVVSIPVIDVSISIYDILGTIRLAKNYTENFAIVGYASITETAHLLCDILGYTIKIITLDESTDTSMTLDILIEEQYEMILCDAITNRLALTKSINTILITSGFESIKHAYQEALTIAKQLKESFMRKQSWKKVFTSKNRILSSLMRPFRCIMQIRRMIYPARSPNF